MALKTGSSEAVQGSFPLLFIALFFSSAFFPRQTMQGAYKVIADINPVSHLVEGIRAWSSTASPHGTSRGAARSHRDRRRLDLVGLAHPPLTIGITMTAAPHLQPRQARGGATLRSARGLALRGLRSIRRLPSAFFPALAMPIFQTIAFSGTFFAITKIPGFPTDRSVNWYLPLACCMGSGFAGVGLGFSTVRDIESGFFDRLRMAPSPRSSLIIGPLFTAWIRVLIVVTTTTIVGFLFGARLTDGVLGLVTLYIAGLGIARKRIGN